MYRQRKVLTQSQLLKNAGHIFSLFLTFLLVLAIQVGFMSSAHAQGWERSYGLINDLSDEGFDLVPLADGGVLAVGVSTFYSSQDVFLLRVDVDGDILWTRNIGGTFSQEYGRAVVVGTDGSFFIGGYRYSGNIEKNNPFFLKVSPSGQPLATRELKLPNDEIVTDIILTTEGKIAFIGSAQNQDSPSDPSDNVLFGILDQNLNEEVMTIIADTLANEATAMIETGDGNLVFIGVAENPASNNSRDIYLRKIQKSGNPVWSSPVYIGGEENDQGTDLVEAPNGDLVICGSTRSQGAGSSDVFVSRLSADGQTLWSEPLILGTSLVDEATRIIRTIDGNYIVSGYIETSSQNVDLLMVKIDGDGNILWEKTFGDEEKIEQGFGVVEQADGSLTLAGAVIQIPSFESDLYLVRTNAEGSFLSNWVKGRITADANLDCFADTDEEGFRDWIVTATHVSTNKVFIGDTDAEGNYQIRIDTGTYQVQLTPSTDIWSACVPSVVVSQTSFFDSSTVDFAVQSTVDCPVMQVDISTPFLRRCVENRYSVRYCNNGSVTAEDARIEVVLDPNLTVIEVVNGPAYTGTDTLLFDLGNVPAQECGRFEILVQHNCTETIEGQAHCVSARIFPDTLCTLPNPDWDGSSLAVSARCENGQLQFLLENKGEEVFVQPLDQLVQYIVIEDDIMLRQEPVKPLQPGEIDTIDISSNQFSTYRMMVDQTPGHPGKSNPTIAVEGCVDNTGTPFAVGYLTMFPEDDGNPSVSISCEESINSLVSNVKRGYPKGFGAGNYIERQTDLTYTVVFHNVGTDTAFYVAIRDTLPAEVQPNTLRFLNSSPSEPTSVSWISDGILKVVFESADLLPDTSLYEFGHITFEVSQNPSNVSGDQIMNSAEIYFDYNAPIQTEKTLHTVIDSLQEVIIVSVDPAPGSNQNQPFPITVYPNPFTQTATFELHAAQTTEPNSVHLSQNRFYLFDVTGRLVRHNYFGGTKFEFRRNGLHSGFYVWRIEVGGEKFATGTIIAK